MRVLLSILAALALLVAPLPLIGPRDAQAVTCPAFPYTLTNGSIADANQVMANFNATNNCIGSSVFNGFSNLAVFNTSGTWVVPAGYSTALVYVTGAGGGGGGAVAGCAAGGGGGGETRLGILTALSGSYTITIGTGGTAGTSAGTNGTNGGSSSFSSIITSSGGIGGNGCTSAVSVLGGGGSNTGSGGQFEAAGTGGGAGYTYTTSPAVMIPGYGGTTFWGGGGRTTLGPGVSVAVCGVGSSGAMNNNAAGAGQFGCVLIFY